MLLSDSMPWHLNKAELVSASSSRQSYSTLLELTQLCLFWAPDLGNEIQRHVFAS